MNLARFISWWLLFSMFAYGFLERTFNFFSDAILTGNELGQYVIISLCFMLLVTIYPDEKY
jgi:hypothetical protein